MVGNEVLGQTADPGQVADTQFAAGGQADATRSRVGSPRALAWSARSWARSRTGSAARTASACGRSRHRRSHSSRLTPII